MFGRVSTGAGIALVGMVMVFAGLIVLALLLPVLKRLVEGGGTADDKKDGGKAPTPEEVAAISAAIHAHFCLMDRIENMKLTWEAYEKPYTPWRVAGRAQLLQEWGFLRNRSR